MQSPGKCPAVQGHFVFKALPKATFKSRQVNVIFSDRSNVESKAWQFPDDAEVILSGKKLFQNVTLQILNFISVS